MERQINVVIPARVEQPISHAGQDTGIQNQSLPAGNKNFLFKARQDSAGQDQQDQDCERKKEKPGPEKESYEKGNNAGEKYVRKTPC